MYGIPSGYEFSTLIEDILMVSHRESGLSGETKALLHDLSEPLHLQGLCDADVPLLPAGSAVATRWQWKATASKGRHGGGHRVPAPSNKYQVMQVLRTMINDTVTGRAPRLNRC